MKNINIDGKDYQLNLSMRKLVTAEKRLGYNPMDIFLSVQENHLPKLNDLMIIFHESLQQFQHGITIDDTVDLFAKYCSEGHSIVDMIEVLVDVIKDSGLIPDEENLKN